MRIYNDEYKAVRKARDNLEATLFKKYQPKPVVQAAIAEQHEEQQEEVRAQTGHVAACVQ